MPLFFFFFFFFSFFLCGKNVAYHGQEDNVFKKFCQIFAFIVIVSTNFDLWMSRGNVNTFVLIINFLSENPIPMLWGCLK
jgi:hypothetical protein